MRTFGSMSNRTYAIFRGAGIVLFGSMIGLGLKTLSKILIARSVSVSDFGIYSLASVIFSMAFVLSLLGMEEGVPRQVAYYKEKAHKIAGSAIIIASASGVIIATILFTTSDFLANSFHEPSLGLALRMFSLALPFSVVSSVMLSTFRGFEMPEVKVYFGDIMRNSLFFALLLVVYIERLSLMGVLVSYDISVIVLFFCLMVLLFKRIDIEFEFSEIKELVKFSIPLLFAIVLGMVMTWTDTIMVGIFERAEDVGLYSAAQSLASLLPILLSATGYMYVPVASRILSEGRDHELKRVYVTVTKWVFVLTMPFFAILVLHPKLILGIFFGRDYERAWKVLAILALGFAFHVVMGLNGANLIVLGGGKVYMYMTLVGAVCNVVLNFLLIPVYGIVGAGIATSTSYILANSIASLKLYKISRLHPFDGNYLKVLLSAAIALLLSKYGSPLQSISIFTVTFFALILLLKCVNDYDKELFSELMK